MSVGNIYIVYIYFIRYGPQKKKNLKKKLKNGMAVLSWWSDLSG